MSAKIKLRREGAKKNPSYKIVVIDSRKPRDGRFIKMLGYYQPTTEPCGFKVDREESLKWIKQGATMTRTVESLFKKNGILDNALSKKNNSK